MSRLEYRLSSALLRALGWLFSWLPRHPRRVALVTARTAALEGNLRAIHDAIRARRPDLEIVLLLDPYGYGPLSKARYLLRMVRGMYHVRTAGTVVVDNAYLPVHVAPHRPGTTVVQVWHAAGALKRFGADATTPLTEPERTFLHRHYDWVVTAGEASRKPWAAALRTPVERVLPLGTPRTDAFFDQDALRAARTRVLGAYPALAGRRVVLYAPTFRGRGKHKRPTEALDAVRLRAALPDDHVLVLKTHPNLDAGLMSTAGYDVVVDPVSEINDLLVVADILVTDYSSSIFEYALLRRPIVLLVGDLAEYEADPGLYLDYRTEMIGARVNDTDAVIDAVLRGGVDVAAYDAFIARHLGACDGHASERFVERFLGDGRD
ncbi:MAG: CDP-glycerol glycerophosphotransferase family protein [Chloroflexi bacterium]|nr:CDP-glycerol glycerophosphotransferase family protein [Chloroflexota bacterium]